ncbi:hypothetical protein ACHQM5_004057 [Ranunculus cassubicifolius]
MLDCFACDQKFEDRKSLVEHQISEHFKCPICQQGFLSNGGMAVHFLRAHNNSKPQYPNATPEVDSTEDEKIGTQGDRSEKLSLHSGEEDEDALSKLTITEMPSSNPVGGTEALAEVVESPPHSNLAPMQPTVNSPLPMTPLIIAVSPCPPFEKSVAIAPSDIEDPDDKQCVAKISTPKGQGSNSYAMGSSTNSPSAGLASVTKPTYNKIYFVWNDEAMSMEEKRWPLYACK